MEVIITKLLVFIVPAVEFIKTMFKLTGNVVIYITLGVGVAAGVIYRFVALPTESIVYMAVLGFLAGGVAAGLWKSAAVLFRKANGE